MADTTSVPTTMRGWAFRNRGVPADVLKLVSDLPAPSSPTGSNIIVKVSHSSLTPSSAYLTAILPATPYFARPYTPEFDFSGVVAALGPKAPSTLSLGTRVFGSTVLNDFVLYGKGSMAEYVSVPADMVVPVPDVKGFGLVEAAALNGNGQTAALMMKNANVKKGGRIFINGGSGGVGTLLIQIAKSEGAYVVATGSGEENSKLVKDLGADEVCVLCLSLSTCFD
jgi:NADPH:quinone reductase-like Zn-dependent oxidoreductase